MAMLRTLPDESIHCCVTSPPYWNLRNYGVAGQIGLEETPEAYVAKMVEVFREVKRVLRGDGTAWVNLGDSYASTPPGCGKDGVSRSSTLHGQISEVYRETLRNGCGQKRNTIVGGLKPKDLCGIPWRVAFALQADGWYLRQDIIWDKVNPMPESVKDRCCKSHEYIFLLSKSKRYYFDGIAIQEPFSNQDVLSVPSGASGNAILQEQSTEGWSFGKVPGLHGGGKEGMGPQVQSHSKGQSDGKALLLFTEGPDGEDGVSQDLRPDAGNEGTLSDCRKKAREGGEIQRAEKEIRYESEGQGDEGGQGQALCQNGKGTVCKNENRNQAQTSNQVGELHPDSESVAGDKTEISESLRVLSGSLQPPGERSRNTIIKGGASHGIEHCSGLSEMQCEQGRKNIIGNMSERGVTRTTEGLNLKTAEEKNRNGTRTKRSVWHISSEPFSGAHFATYPTALVKPCILAGCPVGGTVLDPFAGSGTTGAVALELGRRAILIELNPEYVKLIEQRCAVTPGLPLS